MLIFERSKPARQNLSQAIPHKMELDDIPKNLLRDKLPALPEVSELQAVRHYTVLSQKNFSIDTNFYPLGSCTMKYNPRVANKLSMLDGFITRHPAAHSVLSQGILACMYDLQNILAKVSGMQAVSLAPAAGAQGELAGVAMIKAYHMANNDDARDEFIVPDAAHGTNPASAVMCGYKVKEIPTLASGDVDIEALKKVVGPKTAGIMLTNPSTIGVFERNIAKIAAIVHKAGGLLYYDGANLNAIMGKTNPGIMGFDVVHINVHKTFSTPHGGGGPGAGPVGVGERLKPFLPIPMVDFDGDNYSWLTSKECPQTIGRLSAFAGNVGILLRAYVYVKMLGDAGMKRVAEYSTLNANYLMHELAKSGFDLAFKDRRATHEFIVTLKKPAKELGVNAMDFAKRLLDFGHHAPTTYFPLLIPECFLIEPTETEDKDTLDDFVKVMQQILAEAKTDKDKVKGAPWTLELRRLDDVKAVKELDVAAVL